MRIFFFPFLLAARWGDDYIQKAANTELVLRTKKDLKLASFILA